MLRLYCGSLADEDGLRLVTYDPSSGFDVRQTLDVARPSYLSLDPSRRLLLAAVHAPVFDGRPGGGVRSYRICPGTGRLEPSGSLRLPATHGTHISLDPSGNFGLVACTFGGTAAVLAVAPDGTLGPVTAAVHNPGKVLVPVGHTHRPSVPPLPPGCTAPHCLRTDPSGRVAVLTDLGQDILYVYRFEPSAGVLVESSPLVVPASSGPRHLVFHPDNGRAYLVSEFASTLTVLDVDPDSDQVLSHRQSLSTTPSGSPNGNTASELLLSPSGRFVYVSNRALATIATFAVAADSGEVRPVGQTATEGAWPRGFGLSPSGEYLFAANQHSNNITALRIDPDSGVPTYTGHQVDMPAPTCVVVTDAEVTEGDENELPLPAAHPRGVPPRRPAGRDRRGRDSG